MPFRNSIVSAILATGTSGARIVIDGTGALANYIRFYTGAATENAPATITGRQFPLSDPSYPGALYLAADGARHTDDPARTPASLKLITSPGPNMYAELSGDYVNIDGSAGGVRVHSTQTVDLAADIITLGKGTLPFTDLPALRLGTFSTLNVLGPWVPWSPTISGSTTNPTIGNSTVIARYMRVGRTVTINFSITTGTTWNAGSGNYTISLPFAIPSSYVAGLGGMILSNASGFFVGTSYAGVGGFSALFNSYPASFVGSSQMPSGAGSTLYCGFTYECA